MQPGENKKLDCGCNSRPRKEGFCQSQPRPDVVPSLPSNFSCPESKNISPIVSKATEKTHALNYPDVTVTQNNGLKVIFRELALILDTNIPIVIQGETGTGKELVAKYIHDHSQWRSGPFVPINCAAIARDIAESELFGHVKGSFTGAIADHKGAFESANGGILFLDEISDLPLAIQAKTLRAIQDCGIKQVGSNTTVPVNLRLVCAGNLSLAAQIAAGEFRRDLVYRLCGYQIVLPPLRERKEDIPQLIAHFLKCACFPNAKTFTDAAIDFCIHQRWPGNIRQLQHVVKLSAYLAESRVVDVNHVSHALANLTVEADVNLDKTTAASMHPDVLKIQQLLVSTDSSLSIRSRISQVASQSQVSVSSIYRILATHRITPKELIRRCKNS